MQKNAKSAKQNLEFFNMLPFSVFPRGCSNYSGPHSEECYESMWKSVGCEREGSIQRIETEESDDSVNLM